MPKTDTDTQTSDQVIKHSAADVFGPSTRKGGAWFTMDLGDTIRCKWAGRDTRTSKKGNDYEVVLFVRLEDDIKRDENGKLSPEPEDTLGLLRETRIVNEMIFHGCRLDEEVTLLKSHFEDGFAKFSVVAGP